MDYVGQLYESYYPKMTPIFVAIGVVLTLFVYLVSCGFFCMVHMPHMHLRAFAFTAAVLYYYLILLSTVFTRPENSGIQYELTPFWSYKLAFAGDTELAKEIVLNMIMFIPMGFLITYVVDFLKRTYNKQIFGRMVFRMSLLIGIVCSAMIEILQLLLRRGLFEWDDIFDNTVGFLVGAAGYLLCSKCFEKKDCRGIV